MDESIVAIVLKLITNDRETTFVERCLIIAGLNSKNLTEASEKQFRNGMKLPNN